MTGTEHPDDGAERHAGPDSKSIPDAGRTATITAGSSVLLLASTDAATEHAYTDLEPANDPATARVLAVTYSRTPDEWATDWRTHVGALPTDLGIVAVGEATRSMAATQEGTVARSGAQTGHRVLRSVGSPADLTGVGIGISECLADWEVDSRQGTSRPVVSFGSLTVLLEHVPLDRAFQFLHVLSGRVSHTGAVGYYYLDPDEHDRQTVATLKALFDVVVEQTAGEWTIRTR